MIRRAYGRVKGEGVAACVFFTALVYAGVSWFRGYGIPWDEPVLRYTGIVSLQYAAGIIDSIPLHVLDKYHGPVFEIACAVIEKFIPFSEPSSVYHMRHLANYLLFCAGVFFFYLLCRHLCKERFAPLIGAAMLAASPRIFGDAFFNTKDIPFMVFGIISVFSLVKCLEHKNSLYAFVHAFACALLIGIRAVGVVVPAVTCLALTALVLARVYEAERRMYAPALLAYAVLPLLSAGICLFFRSGTSADLFLSWLARVPLAGIACILAGILPACIVPFLARSAQVRKEASALAWYQISLVVLVLYVWPVLWENPLYHFLYALHQSARFPWGGTVLYLSKYLPADSLPWHYAPVWIAVTTPVVYLFFYCIGLAGGILSGVRRGWGLSTAGITNGIFLGWAAFPLVLTVLLRPVLYDGWRQMYFIYPGVILIALDGMLRVRRALKARSQAVAGMIPCLAMIAGIAGAVFSIARLHPFEHVYFNMFAGRDMRHAGERFELDYWGLSYRSALEYILASDRRERVAVKAAHAPGRYNSLILPGPERARVFFVDDEREADYFITNYRWQREPLPYGVPVFEVRAGNAAIAGVYDLRAR
jgi:hypothetical protein